MLNLSSNRCKLCHFNNIINECLNYLFMICDISIYKSHVIKIVISQYQSYVLSIYLFLFILGKDVSLSIDMSSIIKRKKKKVMQKSDCYVIEIT